MFETAAEKAKGSKDFGMHYTSSCSMLGVVPIKALASTLGLLHVNSKNSWVLRCDESDRDFSRNHCVHITLHPIMASISPCTQSLRPYHPDNDDNNNDDDNDDNGDHDDNDDKNNNNNNDNDDHANNNNNDNDDNNNNDDDNNDDNNDEHRSPLCPS